MVHNLNLGLSFCANGTQIVFNLQNLPAFCYYIILCFSAKKSVRRQQQPFPSWGEKVLLIEITFEI